MLHPSPIARLWEIKRNKPSAAQKGPEWLQCRCYQWSRRLRCRTKFGSRHSDVIGCARTFRHARIYVRTKLLCLSVGSLVNAVELAHGELPKRIRRFDFRAMLQDLARYYDGIGIGRGLQAQIGDLPPELAGDPELLYQVFSNLISNAFKYSPEDGIVTLSAEAKDRFVEVTIEDRGLGIPRDELDRIREPYYRASNVGSVPGTGMGLHLVNEIVRQHAGRLEIDSEEGKGTRVVVILPTEEPSGTSERTSEHDLVRRGRPGDGEPARGGSERTRLFG